MVDFYPLPSLIRGGYISSKFFLFKLTFVNLHSVGVQQPRHRQDSYPPLTTHWCGAGSAASQQTTGRRWCVCHWPWIVHPQVWKSSCRDLQRPWIEVPSPILRQLRCWIRKERAKGPFVSVGFWKFVEMTLFTAHSAHVNWQTANTDCWLKAQAALSKSKLTAESTGVNWPL